MNRRYKCLKNNEFINGTYKLSSIRDEDKYLIMQWRNEQIINLRQKHPIDSSQQEIYFDTVVADLFNQEKPGQLLFSFFENENFIGYGGLVHIDWESKNAEISFLIETVNAKNDIVWAEKFSNFVEILKIIARYELNFVKLYTYGYKVRPYLFKYDVLTSINFKEEACLQNHVMIDGELHDVLIHSYFLK
jgi:RimJ/RimL family protein N-acetyltransferase